MRVRNFRLDGKEYRYIHARNLVTLIQITIANKVKGWIGEICPSPLKDGKYYVGLHRKINI